MRVFSQEGWLDRGRLTHRCVDTIVAYVRTRSEASRRALALDDVRTQRREMIKSMWTIVPGIYDRATFSKGLFVTGEQIMAITTKNGV